MVSPPTPIAPLRHTAARRYDAEWCRLRRRPDALRRAAGWCIVRTDLTSLDEVLRAIGYDRQHNPQHDGAADSRLRRLVSIASNDELAAQVVVRRLLPGALSVAARHRPWAGDDALDELVGALWIAIRTFDPARQPSSLAAALLGDAEYRAFRTRTRRGTRELPSDRVLECPVPDSEPDPAIELADLIARASAAGIADDDDIALARLLVREPNCTTLARHLNVTDRTVRNRRARLAAKLRQVADAA